MFFPFSILIVEYGFKKGLIAPDKRSFISAEHTHDLHMEVMTHLLLSFQEAFVLDA